MALFHLLLGPQRGLHPSDFPTATLPRENFVAKKQHVSSRVWTVQFVHKDKDSIYKNFLPVL